MTDKKPEISKTATASAPGTSSSPGPATSAATPKKPAAPKKKLSNLVVAFIVLLLIAIGLAAALWYQQQQFNQSRAQLSEQASSSGRAASQAADQAQQALQQLQEQARKISQLESAQQASSEQVGSLEQAFQILTDSGSDLVLINDIDHLVTIAQQQLQLSGNVANAIISLETAQAQLARANRPGLASLMQTINGDLDRLRAASTVDIALLSTQLDELSSLVSAAPLLVPDDAAPEPVPAEQGTATPQSQNQANDLEPTAPWWKKAAHNADQWSRAAWNSIQQDLGQFITVRRVDDPTALLMSPEQATRFRETLRLRIMTAQLALMMRQAKVWDAETAVLVKALETRFDPQSPQTRQALKIARQAADTSIELKLPTVTNSLQAIETLRETKAEESGAVQTPDTDASERASDEVPATPPQAPSDAAPTPDEPAVAPAAPQG